MERGSDYIILKTIYEGPMLKHTEKPIQISGISVHNFE